MNTYKVELFKLKKRKSTKTLLYIYTTLMVMISVIDQRIGLKNAKQPTRRTRL